jgi:hypothetical protein
VRTLIGMIVSDMTVLTVAPLEAASHVEIVELSRSVAKTAMRPNSVMQNESGRTARVRHPANLDCGAISSVQETISLFLNTSS